MGGPPRMLLSDNEGGICSPEGPFQALLKRYDVDHGTRAGSSVKDSAHQLGLAERSHAVTVPLFRKTWRDLASDPQAHSWMTPALVMDAAISAKCAVPRKCGYSPYELAFGRKYTMFQPHLWDATSRELEDPRKFHSIVLSMELVADRARRAELAIRSSQAIRNSLTRNRPSREEVDYSVGDFVEFWVDGDTKLATGWLGCARVEHIEASGAILVARTDKGHVRRRPATTFSQTSTISSPIASELKTSSSSAVPSSSSASPS